MVTIQERQKAAKIMAESHKKRERKPPAAPVDNSKKGFSKGEKDLYREIGKIERREEQQRKDEAARTAAFFAKKSYGKTMPVPTMKQQNKDGFGQNSEIALIEWEKNQIKPLFREFDKDKKGVEKAHIKEIVERLKEDECIIGKIPFCEAEDLDQVLESWPEKTNWEYFRNHCNEWEWRMVAYDKLNEVINEFFAKAYKYKMQGKDAEYKDMTTKALRLQGSLTKTKPIQPEPKKGNDLPPRTDTFARVVLRREGNVGPDVDPENTKVLDKTCRYTFAV
jgi:hypothetical protein